MFILFTVLTILSFWVTLTFGIIYYKTKNKKWGKYILIFFLVGILLFLIWGIMRNFYPPLF